MIKLTNKSWVDLREIDSEETLEKAKQKFVESGFRLSSEYAQWRDVKSWEVLTVNDINQIHFSIYFNRFEGYQIHVKDILEEPFGKQLFGYKMRVTPETSELVQKAVFEVGGDWIVSKGQSLSCINSEFLWIDKDGGMFCRTNEEFFHNDLTPEIHLEVVKSLKIVSKEDSKEVKRQKELQEVIDNLKEQLDNAQQQLKAIQEK